MGTTGRCPTLTRIPVWERAAHLWHHRSMLDSRQVNLTLDFCMRVGELLLSNGAGASDVTAVMRSLASHLGLPGAEIDVTFVSIVMHHQSSPEEPPVYVSRTVRSREIDYDDLTRVDHLVREVLSDRLDLRQARAELARIVSTGHSRPSWAVTLGWGVMCAGIAIQLGAGLIVTGLAFVSALCIDRLQSAMLQRRLPAFYVQIAGGAVATILATAATMAPVDVNVSLAVTSNIIMLLAGIGFMGALQDALTGYYITAGARLTEALLATSGIIVGVSGGIGVATMLGVDLPRLDPGRYDLQGIGMLALGAAIGAAAFAYASHAPRRILLPVAAVAAVAILLSRAIEHAGGGRTWAVGVAAFFVGLVSYSVAGRMRVPPLVVVVSAVIPMLPGLSIYRALTLLGEGGGWSTSEGLLSLVTAASVALAVASGVILGEYVAQPLKREARKIERVLVAPGAGAPRLVGPARDWRARRRQRS